MRGKSFGTKRFRYIMKSLKLGTPIKWAADRFKRVKGELIFDKEVVLSNRRAVKLYIRWLDREKSKRKAGPSKAAKAEERLEGVYNLLNVTFGASAPQS